MSKKGGEEGKLLALLNKAKDIAKATTTLEAAQATLDTIKSVLGYDLGAFGIVEEDVVRFITSTGVPGFKELILPLNGKGVSMRAARTGETQLVEDVTKEPAHLPITTIRHNITTHSELDTPVKIEGKVAAIINLESTEPNAFTRHDATLVELLAEHAAAALQRIKQQEQLKASEEIYRRIIESTLEPVVVIQGERVVYTNEANARLRGYDSPAELLGQLHTDSYPPEERERIADMARRRQRGEDIPNRYPMKLLKKDGSTIEVESSVTRITYMGRPAILSYARDMTQWRHYENQIIALHKHSTKIAASDDIKDIAEATLDAVDDVLGFDLLSFLLAENEALHSIANRGIKPITKDFPIDGRGITVRAAREKKSVLVSDVRSDPDYIQGTIATLSELAVPVVLNGETVAVINAESTRTNAFTENDRKLLEILATHVSSAIERIHTRAQLLVQQARSTRDLVEGANKLTAMVRHDLRAPLQTIRNATFLLREHPDKLPEMTNAIDKSVEYAEKILEDLRTMTGPSELQRSLVNLNDLVEATLAQIRIPDNIRVEVKQSDEFIAASIDATRIRRALDNLVKNAVEAMPNGGNLTLHVEKHPDHVTLSVTDTGSGIPPEERPLIFKPFHTTKKMGTGLGLTSAKQAVEAHGGTITYTTKTGKGTTFTITIPTKSP